MEKDGLVIRFANPADKRSVLISLTDKGMGLAKQINSSYSNIDETVLSCLSTEEKDQFLGWIRLVASKYIED
ncbi:hypothetical protein IV72_GL000363 [Atopobium minutum]|nr:hypothetical protein IV72_GL000363 [Atopobium minutum]